MNTSNVIDVVNEPSTLSDDQQVRLSEIYRLLLAIADSMDAAVDESGVET